MSFTRKMRRRQERTQAMAHKAAPRVPLSHIRSDLLERSEVDALLASAELGTLQGSHSFVATEDVPGMVPQDVVGLFRLAGARFTQADWEACPVVMEWADGTVSRRVSARRAR